ncbi:MAG TPA: SbcC/MukB-like Walker B domain-containing protein, partial [Aquihabitans sp.]|nr:SbcC/MukB-like Walker B domain-containing protein [Aquihabitans sp.]
AEAAHRQAKEAALAAWSTHLDLRSRYLDGIAAVLAAALEDAEPCPVCGASEHPRPAEPAAGSVSLDAVDAAERAFDVATRAAEEAAGAVASLQLAEAEALAGAGPEAAANPAAAGAAARAARAEHRAAHAVAATIAEVAARAEALTGRIAEAERRLAAARAAAEAARASAEVKEHEAAVAAALLAEVAGPGSVSDAVGRLRALDGALRALAEQATAGHESTQRVAQARERLAADVAASPFADVAEVEAALLDHPAREALGARVGDHDRRVLAVQDQLGDPLLATLPVDRPDVEGARRAVAAAQDANDRAVARHAQVHEAQGRIAELVAEHGVALAALLPRELEADRCEAVANRCAGRTAPKVSLQRWVLGTYLEAICEHANRRLVTMTAGRYQLRVARDGANAAAKAGLDLWVHDAHTGTLRPVSSLSGGETFQASLALALGVADSVEARTGGVRLDALFVDEGFGSLDPDSLQLAMDELDGLREGGRMVGLISHVGALRERIRVGIEVTPTESGSTVRVGHIAAA